MTTMQNQQKNWGDMMRLHAHIQKQREDFEHQLHRERQTRYKEELDNLLIEKNNMKRMERNVDVELRKRIENDYEQYKHQAVINKHTMKDVQMMFAEDNFRDHYSKQGQEKQLKQMEAMNQQERGNALAELDRMQKLQEKEEKHALLSVQRKDFEDNNKFKHFTQEKQKEQDKQYMDDFSKTLENQHENRQKFFESIRKRGQNPEVMEAYRQYYSEENQRRQEHEKNVIEKARIERLKKEEEMARRKQLEQERMKHETLNALSYQMQTKKEMDHINRQKELELENKQLHDTIEEHDRKMRLRKEFKDKAKSQHVEALNKQLEDLRNRKHNEDILTPLEERFNKNDINILDNRAGPVNLFTSPSFVPGRNLGFERKLQNHYINKALHINNPLSEAHRTHSSHHQEGGSVFPQNSERDSKLQPQSENPYLQAVAKQTLPQSNGYDMQPQNNARAENSLELQQQRYNMPELAKARYTPQYVGNNQPGGPNERLFDDKTSGTPQINNRMRPSNDSSDYNNQVFRSMQDLKPSFSKDYQYIKSKNGIHANPVNIISNELKAPTAYLRNPYSIY